MHFSYVDKSIVRAEGMDERAILAEIDRGARVIVFELVFCLLVSYLHSRKRHLVRPGESPSRVALKPTILTAIGGWWGIALLQTPVSLYRNLSGGVDVTLEVRAELEQRIADKAAKADLERLGSEAARAPEAPLPIRRARVLELLPRGELEEIWSLVGGDIERGEGLAGDAEVVKRVLLGLRSKRLWGRAAIVGEVLRERFPWEVKAYVATALGEVERNGSRPDGWREPTPLWAKVLMILAVLGGLAMTILMAWADVQKR